MENSKNLNADQAGISSDIVEKIDNITSTLSQEQKFWLSQYLAGNNASLKTESIDNDQILTILYGSQTGNSRSIAEELNDAAKEEGIQTELISMGKFKEKNLKKTKNLVVLVSTQGEGDPPDDALNLVDFINSSKAPKLQSTNFAVCALGDSTYEFYCKTGKDFDAKLEELGGKRFLNRVDLDVDFDEDAEAWIKSSITILRDLIPKSTASNASSLVSSKKEVKYTRKRPLKTNLLINQKITGRYSEKDIRHIEIGLEESNLSYKVGDSLGVWFRNSSELVKQLLTITGIKENEKIELDKEKVSIKELLEETYELTQLHPGFIKDYAKTTNNEKLIKIHNDPEKLREYIADRQIIDVIHEHPATLNSSELISMLRKLTPRLYSIASSQAEVEEEVHLTVGVVKYDAFGFSHLGGASGHLSQLEPGAEISIYVESSDHFRLPDNPDTPIIMIGPGTGIAPFRAFIQERAAMDSNGDNWLFFGNPHFTEDFLYQTELQNWKNEGVLTRIDLAFSRDQNQKIYVQHRILEQAEEIWNWINRGAHIYICGDESRMAKDVHDAILTVIEEQGNISAKEASTLLDKLRREGRYQKDVY